MRGPILRNTFFVLHCFAISLSTLPAVSAQTEQQSAESSPLAQFITRAEAGEAEAQYRLRHVYAKGLGVVVDYKEAAKWWAQAVEQGLPAAQNGAGTGLVGEGGRARLTLR
jgi:TPR repeat protein